MKSMKTVSEIDKLKFASLMDKAQGHPNKLEEREMRELAALIPECMHLMPKQEKQKWFASFSNHLFIKFLMQWYQPNTNNVDSQEAAAPAKNKMKPQNGAKDVSPGQGSPGRGNAALGRDELAGTAAQEIVAFGELCRQAYKSRQLYRILGQVSLRDDVLLALQVEVEAELQDALKRSFLGKLFCVRPTLKIPLDQNRFTAAVTHENRLKLDNMLADSVLDVICARMEHPGSSEIKNASPELQQIRNDAKSAILRSLEGTPGLTEVQIPIAKSCRQKEQDEQKKLLKKLEQTAQARQSFFEEAKKKEIAIPEESLQESTRELQRARETLELASANGINRTYVYDMVAVELTDETSFEALLLSNPYKQLHNELSWMHISIGFDASFREGDKQQQVATEWLDKATELFAKRPSITRLGELMEVVKSLRRVTITPMSLSQVLDVQVFDVQVLDVETNFFTHQDIEAFKKRLSFCSNPNDPDQITTLRKLQADMYSHLQKQPDLNSAHPATKAFLDTYESTVLKPKLVMLEGVYQEISSTFSKEFTRRTEILQKITQAKRKENLQANIQEIEANLREALAGVLNKDAKFLEAHKSCKRLVEQPMLSK